MITIEQARRIIAAGEARAKAAAELLRLPHRAAVEVWRGPALIYARRRRDAVPRSGSADERA